MFGCRFPASAGPDPAAAATLVARRAGMAATDPTGVAGKLRVLESRVLVCYSDKGGGADKLSGEHAPRHAAATLAALGPRTPQLQCDLGDAPLVDGRGDLAPAVRDFLRETP